MVSSSFAADVTRDSFESEVLLRSRATPVLVDFWAAWCGPCKVLMPVLSRLAEEYGGKFFLAKVNSDEQQQLAGQYGVRSLPTVKLFRHGQVVDEFLGAQSENTVRAFLDRHLPRESDAAIGSAQLAARAGRLDKALALLQQAMHNDPANDRVKFELARLLLHAGRVADAQSAIDALTADARDSADAVALRAQLEFARIVQSARAPQELLEIVQAGGKVSAARYELAAHLVVRQQYPEALDQLLEIVRTDRKWNDDAARKGMISVFNLLGGSGELVNEYRRKLSMALN
jgi:putative thioredoxin